MAKKALVIVFSVFLLLLLDKRNYCSAEEEDDLLEDDVDEAGDGDLRGTRPRRVSAEVINATTVNLTWKPPRLLDETCPVRRYVLRLKQDGAKNSRAWKVDGARQALGLHNLKRDTTYYLRLVSISCKGKGRPSKWITVRTTEAREYDELEDGWPIENQRNKRGGTETRPPGKPTYVRTRTFTDSVILTWRPPEDNGIVVRGYMVGYGEGVPDVNWQYVDASHRNVTIKNLKSATQYIISLRAFNNFGKGPTVYDLIYTREKAEHAVNPESILPPTNLRAKILSPTTVWLQWTDTSLGRPQLINDDRYYNVHYQRTDAADSETLSMVVKALHVVLYDLEPGTGYTYRVRTVKNSAYSDFSIPVTNTTFETAPGSPPRSLIISPANGTSAVQMSWRPPKQPNGKITGFLVLYTMNRNLPVADWKALATTETKAIIEDLSANTTFYFKAQARNSIGYGPLSKTAVFATPLDWNDIRAMVVIPDAEVVDDIQDEDLEQAEEGHVADNEAGVAAEGTQPSGGDVIEDLLDDLNDANTSHFSPLHSSSDRDTVKTKRHDPPTRSDAAAGRTPATGAEADAADTMTSQQQASSSGAVSKTHKVGPPGGIGEITFTAELLHKISAFITWPVSPPGCDCDEHAHELSYAFHYYMRGEEEQPSMRVLSTNVVHMDDLRLGATYLYQVKYIFPNGTETSWSQEQVLSTACSKG